MSSSTYYCLKNSSDSVVATLSGLPTATLYGATTNAGTQTTNGCYAFSINGTYYYCDYARYGTGTASQTFTVSGTIFTFTSLIAVGDRAKGATIYAKTITSNKISQASSKTLSLGTTVYDASGNSYTIATATAYRYDLDVESVKVNNSVVGYIRSVGGTTNTNKTLVSKSYAWEGESSSTKSVAVYIRTNTSSASELTTWLSKYYLASVSFSDGSTTSDITSNVKSTTVKSTSTYVDYYVTLALSGSSSANVITFNFAQYETRTVNVDIFKGVAQDGSYVEVMSVYGYTGTDNGSSVQYTLSQTVLQGASASYSFMLKPTSAALNAENDIFYIANQTGADSVSFNSTTKAYTLSGSTSTTAKTISVSFGRYINITATPDSGVASYSFAATGVTDETLTMRSAVKSGTMLRLPNSGSIQYTITATTTDNRFFTSTACISGNPPSATCHSYTTNTIYSGGGDVDYTIATQTFTIKTAFQNSDHAQYGALGVSADGSTYVDAGVEIDLSEQAYYLRFSPIDVTDNPYAWMVDSWVFSDGTAIEMDSSSDDYGEESVATFTPESVTQSLTAYAVLKQRRWAVDISNTTGGNVTVHVCKKETQAIVATFTNKLGVSRPIDPETEFIVLVPSALTNYKFSDFAASSNLKTYSDWSGDGYAYCFEIYEATSFYNDASITVKFTRSNFFLQFVASDPDVCSVKIMSEDEDGVIGATSGYFSKDTYTSTIPLTFDAFVSGNKDTAKYSVSAFKIYYGSEIIRDEDGNIANTLYQTIEPEVDSSSATQMIYYNGWYYNNNTTYNDYIIEAVVQPLVFNFKLVVKHGSFETVDGVETFVESSKRWGYVNTTIGDETDIQNDSFERAIREDTDISVKCGTFYGGKCVRISVESGGEVTNYDNVDQLKYDMPLADATITVYFSERTTYTANVNAFCYGGSTNPYCGELTIASTRYPESYTHTTNVLTPDAKESVSLYHDEEYTVTYATPGSDFDRRYFFSCWGWLDQEDFGDASYADYEKSYADTHKIYVTDETQEYLRLAAIFGQRATAPVTISYAIRKLVDGEEVITDVAEDELDTLLPGCSLTLDESEYLDEATGYYYTGSDVIIGCKISGSTRTFTEGDLSGVKTYRPTYVQYGVSEPVYATIGAWDRGLDQEVTFKMTAAIFLRAVFTEEPKYGMTKLSLRYHGQGSTSMGVMSAFATDMDSFQALEVGCDVSVRAKSRAVIMASVSPGYLFAGWYRLVDDEYVLVDKSAVYEVDGDDLGSGEHVYYANFLPSMYSQLLEWNAGDEAKSFKWRSKVFVGSSYYAVNSIMVYADDYPVTVTCYSASSPRDVWTQKNNVISFKIYNQRAQRIPYMKPEKYFGVLVEGSARINHVAIASSMEALR